jgi:hypothetical protein
MRRAVARHRPSETPHGIHCTHSHRHDLPYTPTQCACYSRRSRYSHKHVRSTISLARSHRDLPRLSPKHKHAMGGTAPRIQACTTHRRLIDRGPSTQQASHALHVTILAGDAQRRDTVRLKHHITYTVHITSPSLPYTPPQRACYSRRSRYFHKHIGSTISLARSHRRVASQRTPLPTQASTQAALHPRTQYPHSAAPSSVHNPPSPD